MTRGRARPDTEVVFDPATYVNGVPFDALARLRRDHGVVWVAEIPVSGWPAGPGFWLVLRHADVSTALTRPSLFSSALGATQIRDPSSTAALDYIRRMMLNMDPPEHARLRRLLIRAGDKVVVSFAAANRDESVFPDPERFDIRRQPNPPLVIGPARTSAWASNWPACRCRPCSPGSRAHVIP